MTTNTRTTDKRTEEKSKSCGDWFAGMIGNFETYWYNPRGAPGVDLYNANGLSSHQEDLDWLWANGVPIEIEPFVGPFTNIYWQDWYSIVGMTILRAAGNGGWNDSAQCDALGPICVGAYSVAAPGGFWVWTSTKNFDSCPGPSPTGCDREVPDVTFHGDNVQSTSNAPGANYTSDSGTSYAAPAAAGLVALMHQRWWNIFAYWSEVVRAALMASATVDLLTPDPGPPPKTYSDYRSPDERDGAGVPDAARIEDMVNNNRISWYVWTPSSFVDNKLIVGHAGSRRQAHPCGPLVGWLSGPGSPGGLRPPYPRPEQQQCHELRLV